MDIPIPTSLQYLCQYATKMDLFPALWLVEHNFTILTHHHSVSRSPVLGHLNKICKQSYFHYFILLYWYLNVNSINVHNFRTLMI